MHRQRDGRSGRLPRNGFNRNGRRQQIDVRIDEPGSHGSSDDVAGCGARRQLARERLRSLLPGVLRFGEIEIHVTPFYARVGGPSLDEAGRSTYVCETFENRLEPLRRHAELLGQHARFADHGHEVGVAHPARDEVHVQVMLNAAAGRLPEIEPHVDAARLVRFAQHDLRSLRELGDLVQFLGRQSAERGDVPARNHHEVPVVVRIAIEDDVGRAAEMHDERIDARARLPAGRRLPRLQP